MMGDELDHVCAWGRWSSGEALNDAMLEPGGGRDETRVARWTPGAASGLRGRNTRRLRLVADAGPRGVRVVHPVR
jgi:hypothetical protein